MKIIKELRIENYRGINELKLEPNSINVIVGPNNTGKSAILEAIGLFLTFPNKFNDSTGENVLEYLFRRKGYDPSYLIHVNKSSAEIAGETGGRRHRLEIEYVREGFPDNGKSGVILQYFERKADDLMKDPKFILSMIRNFDRIKFLDDKMRMWDILRLTNDYIVDKEKLSERVGSFLEDLRNEFMVWVHNSPKLILSLYNEREEIEGLYVCFPETFTGKIPGLSPTDIKGFYVIPFNERPETRNVFRTLRSINTESTERLYDQIIESGKKTLYDAEKMLMERVANVDKIVKTDKGIMIFTKDLDRPVPLSSMGEGFLTLLYITYVLAMGKGGVILLEEPESSLHPGYGNIVAEQLVHNSDRAQIFLTTHSIDLLEAILKKGERRGKLNEINVIRLHYRSSSGVVLPEVISGVDAKEEIDEIGTDLRYT